MGRIKINILILPIFSFHYSLQKKLIDCDELQLL